DQLGLSTRLRGNGPPRRGACPLHRGDGRGRTFSVNLEANVFQCFDKQCGHEGDVIDLWAALHGLSLREAALELVRTFGPEACARPATEKRNVQGTVEHVWAANRSWGRSRSGCAPTRGEEPFLPAVITGTALDIERYICSDLFGPAALLKTISHPA